VGTTEEVIKNHLKNHLRSTFDKRGVWSSLELTMYVACLGGKNWLEEPERPIFAQPRELAS
jgi:hypothetical protein